MQWPLSSSTPQERDAGGSQIALGTFGGFIVGAAIITLVGDRVGIYWVLLPVAVFLAAYTRQDVLGGRPRGILIFPHHDDCDQPSRQLLRR